MTHEESKKYHREWSQRKRDNNPKYVESINEKARQKRKANDKMAMYLNKFDLTGKLFGRLTVLYKSKKGTKHTPSKWLCVCECGEGAEVLGSNLRRGFTTSCGCYRVENSAQLNLIHGDSKCKEYNSWVGMKQRCYNPENDDFEDYGGRGIFVCERWINSFPNFLEDMGRCPEGSTLDRIKVNLNYDPTNCRWADVYTQMNNTRRNVFVTCKNETLTLAQWARKLGINDGEFYYKRNQHLSIEQIVELYYK